MNTLRKEVGMIKHVSPRGWFRTDVSEANTGMWADIDWEGDFGVDRTHPTDTVWVNVDSGASLALISHGEWRRAPESQFRVFRRSGPGAVPVELTDEVLSGSGHFDASRTGLAIYEAPEKQCVAVIDSLLGLTPAQTP